MTPRPPLRRAGSLVLSLFPGIDMLGKGFEAEGFCVVRGPDPIFGGDIRDFHPPSSFTGVIGGPPCQDFSKARRTAPTGQGEEMLAEFARCVTETNPAWWLAENVIGVPDISIPGYHVQRFNLNARDCGLTQNRPRRFQFGFRDGPALALARLDTPDSFQPACLATEGKRQNRRTWEDFCEAQGLPRDFTLAGWSQAARYRAVGNGVPPPMDSMIARAILNRGRSQPFRLCACECGRSVHGRSTTATPACRKRMQRMRDAAAVTVPGMVTADLSL